MRRIAEPFSFRKLHLAHRLIMAPMTTSRARPDGGPTPWSLAHYRERVRGGASLLITEATYVTQAGKGYQDQLGVHRDSLIPDLASLVSAIHEAGAPFALQLFHGGRTCYPDISGEEVVAPSPLPHPGSYATPRELTVPEIEKIVQEFGEAAARARKAGFDAVEIHGATWYICQQFYSPVSNLRKDAYGGSRERRMRFPLEVARAVRKGAGPEVVVGYRMVPKEPWEGGITIEDSVELARALVEAGVDWLHISRNGRVGAPVKPEEYVEGFRAIRRAVPVAMIANGGVFKPEDAGALLDLGADLVALGRSILADPHFPRKALEGRESYTCIQCKPCTFMRDSRCPEEVYKGKKPPELQDLWAIEGALEPTGYVPLPTRVR